MRDERKTNAELIEELSMLRSRVAQIEQADIRDESDQTFRMVFDNAPDGMLLADAETGKFCMCNNAVCQMLGFDREEITKLRVSDIHPAEHLPCVMEQFERQASGELSLGKNIPVKRKDGSVFYADISSSPTTLAGRKYLMGVFRDVTERKLAEQALQESEDKFRRITERGFDVVLTADLNGTLTYVSPSTTRVFGYTPDEMVGKSAMQFTVDSSLPEVIRQFKEVAEGRSFEGREVEIRRKDGNIAVVELNCEPISKDGRLIGAMASARDITVRRRAENALRESEEKYRTLVESAGESIASIDKDGVFLFMNKIGAERLGGKPDDYVGKSMWDLFPKEVADQQMSSVQKVMETGKGMTVIVPTELQGQLRWHNTTVEPLRDGSGKVVSVMVIARDIHDVKQAEEELSRYREKMARAEQLASLGTLSATAAHELTQPLTVVRLSLDNLLDDLKAMSIPETVIRRLQNSLTEVSNLTSIIDRFRSFARKSSERTVEQVDLNTVAENIARLLNESSRQARVTLQLKDMDKLPPVSMNERDSEQLFFALVQNAIHAADGKKDRQVVIGGLVKDDRIELRFSDDCGGIAPEYLDNVFEPFYTTKPTGQGTGLGLCIVQDIATRAGGKVSVESELGRGTTFLVTLPVYEAGIS
ncbi:MAG: hypothetical protein CEE38_23005 [Planctomycetes bacterium B3_Pla]|nr:MAG: hypothetical protein CEE38_23005 [Planctomycetes bacterium B3_Pla]